MASIWRLNGNVGGVGGSRRNDVMRCVIGDATKRKWQSNWIHSQVSSLVLMTMTDGLVCSCFSFFFCIQIEMQSIFSLTRAIFRLFIRMTFLVFEKKKEKQLHSHQFEVAFVRKILIRCLIYFCVIYTLLSLVVISLASNYWFNQTSICIHISSLPTADDLLL